MKKIALLLAVSLMFVGCGKSDNRIAAADEFSEADFQSVCLDGVQYWMRAAARKGYLAVRIDPNTLKPVNCFKDIQP